MGSFKRQALSHRRADRRSAAIFRLAAAIIKLRSRCSMVSVVGFERDNRWNSAVNTYQ